MPEAQYEHVFYWAQVQYLTVCVQANVTYLISDVIQTRFGSAMTLLNSQHSVQYTHCHSITTLLLIIEYEYNTNNNTTIIFIVLSSCLKHCESSPWFTRWMRWMQHSAKWLPIGLSHKPTCKLHSPSPFYYYSAQKVILTLPSHGELKAELTYVTGYIPRWYTCPQTITHPSINPTCTLIETNVLPLSHVTTCDVINVRFSHKRYVTVKWNDHCRRPCCQLYRKHDLSFVTNETANNTYNSLLEVTKNWTRLGLLSHFYSVSQKKSPLPRGPDIFSFFSQTVANL